TLSHPRARKDTAFQAIEDRVYAAVAGKTEEEIPAPGLKNKLPRASLDALAGLVERLAAEGGRVDLYRLSADLVLELDDLLPIVETGELIEFLVVEEGDLILRPLGQMYADATILARKELLAGRILRLPTIIWIYDTLKKDDNQRIDKHYFIDMFRAELGDIAKEQFDVAVSWGRYAELFDYDPRTDELYLES
nr:AAA-associated domain-containing protein [Deltaproteobacteria bacterium]